jgi:hypothetical protein
MMNHQQEAETARVSSVRINAVLDAKEFDSEIAMLLAIGAVCPFEFWQDKVVWLRVFYRMATLHGYYMPKAEP